MTDHSIRPWRPEDKPQLVNLWETAFGDSPDYIRRFHSLFLTEASSCLVAEAGGKAVSAMYVLPGVTLRPGRKSTLAAGYTYALATLPEYRGQGIGTAVYKAACTAALESADAACVLPAEAPLYPFYQQATDAKPVSFIREARFTRAALAGLAAGKAARVTAPEYAVIRETLLRGMPHAAFPDAFYELMEADGTDFFMLEGGLAAAETDGNICRVTELLDPDGDGMRSVACLAAWCPAEEYIVRSPVFSDGPGDIRPFVLSVLKQAPASPLPDDLWWGFGLE